MKGIERQGRITLRISARAETYKALLETFTGKRFTFTTRALRMPKFTFKPRLKFECNYMRFHIPFDRSLRYAGAKPLIILYVNNRILQLMRCSTGSQCRCQLSTLCQLSSSIQLQRALVRSQASQTHDSRNRSNK